MRGAHRRLDALDLLFLSTLAATTWHKVAWNVAGRVTLAEILATAFVIGLVSRRVATRDARVAPPVAVTAAIVLGLFAVYVAGYGNVATAEGTRQWTKGIALLATHYAFLLAAVAHLTRRGRELYATAGVVAVAGFLANIVYGLVQGVAQYGAGVNLDRIVLEPLFPGAGTSGLILTGQVSTLDQNGALAQSGIYRLTALTNDPNHLGVLLTAPLLVGLALALTWPAWRRPCGAIAAACLLTQLATQSRSGLLGTVAGGLVLASFLRAGIEWRALVAPATALALAAALLFAASPTYAQRVLSSRLDTGSRGADLHREVYGRIGPALAAHPIAGTGINTFAVQFAFDTGKTGFGPHSGYVWILTETGLAGAALQAILIAYALASTRRLVRTGRTTGDQRLIGLGAGLAAATVASLAGNVFYLTLPFTYWMVLLAFAIAGPYALRPQVG